MTVTDGPSFSFGVPASLHAFPVFESSLPARALASREWAMRNITVDDASSGSELVYEPPLCNGTGWTINTARGDGGSYRWCGAPGVKATFRFTGVAVHYVCPTFSGQSVEFLLDGTPSGSVDLGETPSPVEGPRIVWSQTGLEHGQHTLEVLPGVDSSRVHIDSFIYTVLDPDEIAALNATQPTLPPNGSANPPGTAAVSAAHTETDLEKNQTLIIVGSLVGFFVVAIFILISINLWKQDRKRSAAFTWDAPIPPLPVGDSGNYASSNGEAGVAVSSPRRTHHSRQMHEDRSQRTVSPRTQHSIPAVPLKPYHTKPEDSSDESDGEYEVANVQLTQYRHNSVHTTTPISPVSRGQQVVTRPTYPPARLSSAQTIRLEPVRRPGPR